MVILNSLLILCLIFILYRFGQIKVECSQLEVKIDELVILASARAEANEQEWKSVADAIKIIADSLNKSFPALNDYMNYTSGALQHTLVCLRPFVVTELNIAVEREDYKQAQECQNLLNSLNRIININQTQKP